VAVQARRAVGDHFLFLVSYIIYHLGDLCSHLADLYYHLSDLRSHLADVRSHLADLCSHLHVVYGSIGPCLGDTSPPTQLYTWFHRLI
jgi:hypothetical protein